MTVNQELKTPFIVKISNKEEHDYYKSCLELFWSNKSNLLIKKIATRINHHDYGLFSPLYFRLWIETLAKNNEIYALKELLNHLLKATAHLENQNSYLALRGIIHLELDQVEACRELNQRLSKVNNNPYFTEFKQLFILRELSDDLTIENLFTLPSKPIVDYFHWQTYLKVSFLQGKWDIISKVTSYLKNNYGETPLYHTYQAFEKLEFSDLSGAKEEYASLQKKYPENTDYAVWNSYLALCNESYKESLKILKKTSDHTQNNDPDISSLLSYTYYQLAEGDIYSSFWEKAKQETEKSMRLLKSNNLPTKEIKVIIESMKNMENLNQKEMTDTESKKIDHQFWLVPLSYKKVFDFYDGDKNAFKKIYLPLQRSTKIGDLIFLVGKGSSDQIGHHKIIAIYEVKKNNLIDPIDGYLTELVQIKKFKFSLNLILEKKHYTTEDKKSDPKIADRGSPLTKSGVKHIVKHFEKAFSVFNQDEELKELIEKVS